MTNLWPSASRNESRKAFCPMPLRRFLCALRSFALLTSRVIPRRSTGLPAIRAGPIRPTRSVSLDTPRTPHAHPTHNPTHNPTHTLRTPCAVSSHSTLHFAGNPAAPPANAENTARQAVPNQSGGKKVKFRPIGILRPGGPLFSLELGGSAMAPPHPPTIGADHAWNWDIGSWSVSTRPGPDE
jgi:hypothetical protein